MQTMSGRERLMRVMKQQPTDRMPIWLWGVDPISNGLALSSFNQVDPPGSRCTKWWKNTN